jgi:hypothetical protein
MSDIVTAALVSGVIALVSGLISGLLGSKIIAYRVEQLEKKVDKHNGLVERMAVVEQSTKSAHYRINGLEAKP